MFSRVRITCAALAMIVTAGCGGSAGTPFVPAPAPSPSPLPTLAGTSMSAAKLLTVASGGTVSLSGGSVSLSPNVLSTDAVVQLATVPQLQETAPSASVTPVGPMIRMAVYPSGSPTQSHRRAVRDVSQNTVVYTMAVSGDVATGLAAMSRLRRPSDGGAPTATFILPIARIYEPGRPDRYLDISPKFTFDPTAAVITAVLTGNAAQFAVGSIVEFFLVKSSGGDPACGLQGRFAPGLRYYDPNARAWTTGAPPNQPTHALLVLHGILSCVEGSFETGLVERYRADGAYDYIIGYDYDWFQDPAVIAGQIADAVNGLGLTKIDIFAHSYGAVNAMATVPLLNVQSIDNIVLYAGPLDGSFLDDQVVYQTFLIDGASAGYPISTAITAALIANATEIFIPGNTELANIKTAFVHSNKVAHVLKLAGTLPLPVNATTTFADVYTKITGLIPPTNDGIVAVTSAEDPGVQGTQPAMTQGPNDTVNALTAQTDFLATHTQLVHDSVFQLATEKFVAPRLSYEFDNAGDGGLYPDSGAAIVMKGVGTRAHFYPVNAYSTVTYAVDSFNGGFLTYAPPSVPVVNGTSSTPITFTVQTSPSTPIAVAGGQAVPSATARFSFTDANGDQSFYQGDFFILPDCVSCSTTQSIVRQPLFDRLIRRPAGSRSAGPTISNRSASGT